MRAAERVDGLRVVADDAQVPVLAGDEVDDVALQPVRVLVLVHEHVAPAVRERPPDRLPLREQDLPVEEQVVEVHRVQLVLPLGVAARDAQDVVLERRELRAPRRRRRRRAASACSSPSRRGR